jgi:UDP-N-acetylglucosamine acyltransferase
MDALPHHYEAPTDVTAIHPTASVDSRSSLGVGVTIGPFCVVGPHVIIEDRATLVSHVVVDGVTRIGPEVSLYPFVTVGLAPQDRKYRDEPTRCEVGARTQVREHCTIHRGTANGRGITTIGSDCMLMAVAHVAHDCNLGNNVVVANNAVMGGHVSIGDHAVIGGAAAIHQSVRIGRAAMIGGVSGVEADVIPFGTVMGNRAKLAGLNVIGLKRRGFDKAQIQRLHQAFGLLFRGAGVFARRLEDVRTRFADDCLVQEILTFIDEPSERGLTHT